MKKENTIDVMIESPKGSHYKLDYEAENHQFRLSKILPAGLVFPFDFGMIPGTKGEDGDPLDVIVVSELSTFPGCVMEVGSSGHCRPSRRKGMAKPCVTTASWRSRWSRSYSRISTNWQHCRIASLTNWNIFLGIIMNRRANHFG